MTLSDRIISYAGTRNIDEGFILAKNVKLVAEQLKILDIKNMTQKGYIEFINEIFGKELTTCPEPLTKDWKCKICDEEVNDNELCKCLRDYNNTQQDERARRGNLDSTSNEVIFNASQSTSNKRDMGNPVETKHPIYKCGHRQETIFLDDNILSVCAYEMWVSSYGYRGDGSQCWDCYCKDSQPLSKKGFGRSYGYATPNNDKQFMEEFNEKRRLEQEEETRLKNKLDKSISNLRDSPSHEETNK